MASPHSRTYARFAVNSTWTCRSLHTAPSVIGSPCGGSGNFQMGTPLLQVVTRETRKSFHKMAPSFPTVFRSLRNRTMRLRSTLSSPTSRLRQMICWSPCPWRLALRLSTMSRRLSNRLGHGAPLKRGAAVPSSGPTHEQQQALRCCSDGGFSPRQSFAPLFRELTFLRR